MSNLQIKDLPEDLHGELRQRAAQRGTSVRDYVLDLIRRDLAVPSVEDWLASVRRLGPVALPTTSADLVREGRDERNRSDRRR